MLEGFEYDHLIWELYVRYNVHIVLLHLKVICLVIWPELVVDITVTYKAVLIY